VVKSVPGRVKSSTYDLPQDGFIYGAGEPAVPLSRIAYSPLPSTPLAHSIGDAYSGNANIGTVLLNNQQMPRLSRTVSALAQQTRDMPDMYWRCCKCARAALTCGGAAVVRKDPEGAGQVISRWNVSKPSVAKTSDRNLIKVDFVLQGHLTILVLEVLRRRTVVGYCAGV
jgi:hypothetical protein